VRSLLVFVGVVALAVFAASRLRPGAWYSTLARPGYALVDIALLFALIVWFVIAAAPVSAVAAWLFIPFLLWIGFASALNMAIWHLNRKA